ncbi:hypothetical protein [uncultured Methanomethylovorans sp.]|uniref:hypothetical protein n=1 Tax=uncultured Methanomethylovorans sp. TaxID=183759 RepID=UPI002AA75F10|nr:hypothetical protein [uncultured Methanomethylovorans sp.]
MKDDPGKLREKILFAVFAGFLYVLAGSIQFVLSIGVMLDISSVHSLENSALGFLFAPSDFMGSLVLVLIGSIFLYGLMELRNGLNEGIAYVYVGILISLLFATVYTLVMAGNWVESYLLNDPKITGWSFSDDFRPAIYLGILSLCGYILWKKDFRNMDK